MPRARALCLALASLSFAFGVEAQRGPATARILAAVRSRASEVSRPACHEGTTTPIARADRVALVGERITLASGGVAALTRVAAGLHEPDGTAAYEHDVVVLDRRGAVLRMQSLDFGVGAVRADLVVHDFRAEDMDDDGEPELVVDVEVVGATDCSLGRCAVRRLWFLPLREGGSSGILIERSSTCDGPAGEQRSSEIEIRDVDGDGHRDVVTREHRCARNREHEVVCIDSTWTDYWAPGDSYERR